jgi:NadR type nicotinamide-nucleotide adenylyltransferase
MSTLQRVAILGAPSSGKSTLAAALAARYNTLWVPEYLREFVDQHDRVPLSGDQFPIAHEQCAREDAAAAVAQAMGGKYLFCDTTALMTAVYSRHYFGGIDRELAALTAARRYDITLVAAQDIPWVADGLQRDAEHVSRIIFDLLIDELESRAVRYHLIEGNPQQRMAQVAQLLE